MKFWIGLGVGVVVGVAGTFLFALIMAYSHMH
jgi:hypothetical protein